MTCNGTPAVLSMTGRLRDPVLYLLVVVAFGLGNGSGLLVRAAESTSAPYADHVDRLQRQVDAHLRSGGMHDDGSRLRALVVQEIDRSLRPIERELAQIRIELRRVHAKLDQGLAGGLVSPQAS